MRALIAKLKPYERQLSALAMIGGFVFDNFAFGRIDHAMTQAVFIVYLLVAGISIAVLHGLESRPDGRKPSDKTRTILVAVTQFALGCLLSGFCVFYIRSASVTSSWPFLLAMAAIFIGNEYLRQYHARLVFAALLFFFALYLITHSGGHGSVHVTGTEVALLVIAVIGVYAGWQVGGRTMLRHIGERNYRTQIAAAKSISSIWGRWFSDPK